MRGAYVIVLTLDISIELNVGRNCWKLKSGTYAYIGSGMVNLEKRVLRHFSSSKNLHWHMKYLK
jgi:Uri superfamily endonuclease